MGWVTLAARKQSLRLSINSFEQRDLQLGRSKRSTERSNAYEQSIIKNNKAVELREIKNTLDDAKSDKPEMDSEDYNEWYTEYQSAKEDYDARRVEITEMYDDELAMLEEECSDKEAEIEQEQQSVESQLESINAEYDVVKEQISKEIEQSAIKI